MYLRNGDTKSCGCLKGENHGHSKERLYTVWAGMKARCKNKNNTSYYRYGARGISVCAQWDESYASFRQWARENGYDPNAEYGKCTLDRIDSDGDYCPENCRWVSMATQNENKAPFKQPKHRRRRPFRLGDRLYGSMREFTDETGLSYDSLRVRVAKGMSVQDALADMSIDKRLKKTHPEICDRASEVLTAAGFGSTDSITGGERL